MTTLLAFLVTISVLVVFHEYGHYQVARACGVKVERFSFGFGPVIWRYQRTPDSTEFVVSAFPLGGYVRMLGHGPEPVPSSQEAVAFRYKPLWRRSAIVLAGPAANFLLAIVLYASSNWIGVDEPQARLGTPASSTVAAQAGLRAGDWVRSMSSDGLTWQEVRSMSDLRWAVTQAVLNGERLHLSVSDARGHGARSVVLELDKLGTKEVDAVVMRRVGVSLWMGEPVLRTLEPGPAREAGLKSGDRVLSVDGVAIDDANELLAVIRADANKTPMAWRVERDGQVLSMTVTPERVLDRKEHIGRVNAALGQRPETEKVSYSFAEGLTRAVIHTWDMSALTLKMLWRMITFDASWKQLSGVLTIADYAGQSVRLGLSYYLGFLAVLSVSLGVLNLLPVPVLDGGHLMYHLFEAVTGRPPSDVWLDRLTRGGLVIMSMMMLLAFFNDVARLMGLH